MFVKIIISIAISLLFLPHSVYADTPLYSSYSPYNSTLNLSNHYSTNTGVSTVGKTYFGVYAFAYYNNKVYIGTSDNRPLVGGPAALSQLDKTSITYNGLLDHEGVLNMLSYKDKLLIPGVDPVPVLTPTNMQIFDGTSISTYSTGLDNAVHMLDVITGSDGNLYAGVAEYDGVHVVCNTTTECWGAVMKSTDNGQTWQQIHKFDAYRVYDLIMLGNTMFAITDDPVNYTMRNLYKSTDNGQTWQAVLSASQINRISAVKWNNKIIAFGGSNTSAPDTVYIIDELGNVMQKTLPFSPSVITGLTNYTPVSVAPDDYVYVITNDKRIIRSKDLDTWQTVVAINPTDSAISTYYLASTNELLFSTYGANANVYFLNLPPLEMPTPTPTPITSPTTSEKQSNNTTEKVILPDLYKNAGGILRKNDVETIVESDTFNYDVNYSVDKDTSKYPQIINKRYYPVSPLYNVWFTSYHNHAKVYDQNKKSVLVIYYEDSILSNDGKRFFKPNGLRIAYSKDGKKWSLLPSKINYTNKNVGAVTQVGGYYLLLGDSYQSYTKK